MPKNCAHSFRQKSYFLQCIQLYSNTVRALAMNYISVVPIPELRISPNRTAPLYAGTGLTLTCTAIIHNNMDNSLEITAEWSGPRNISGERYTISHMTHSGDFNLFTLTISPLTIQDEGIYFCHVTTTVGSQLATTNTTVGINVMSK